MTATCQNPNSTTERPIGKKKAYLVGGGIASLASAVYLIREGHMPGKNIHIFEESTELGGSLDAHGSAEKGYVMRGGRMFDAAAYACTYDLLSSIPSLRDPHKTVKDDMFDFHKKIQNDSRCRLVEHGEKVDVSSPGFHWKDRRDLVKTSYLLTHYSTTRHSVSSPWSIEHRSLNRTGKETVCLLSSSSLFCNTSRKKTLITERKYPLTH